LAVGGLLGELLHARQAGMLASLRPELDRLRSWAGFFVDSEIERFIPSQVGD
jgi:predicted nucleic acid-binding protein